MILRAIGIIVSALRTICIYIDSIAFGLIDDAYNLIDSFAKASLVNNAAVEKIRNNVYVIIGVFAIFRLAILLINSIIDPDKLTEKGKGIGNMLANIIITFVLLIATPLLFSESLNLQKTIVEGNYIQKLFSANDNSDSTTNPDYNPGDTMRSIALGSLITLNENLVENGNCSGKCMEAVEAYQEMEEADDFKITVLAKYIGQTGKVDGEEEYVYDYKMIITFAAGCFITYVLFSFAIDIAVRLVELTVLEILSPLFIVTYIDPSSAKSGPFNKFIKAVGKSYASLYIKLAIVSIMVLMMGLVKEINLEGAGAFGKLIIFIAILIFSKKAPKWIGDMLGTDFDSGSLSIGKKLGGAALLGGALTKAGHAAAGAARTAGGNVLATARDNRARRKQTRKENGLNGGIGKDARQARKDWYNSNGYSDRNFFAKRKALSDARKEAYGRDGDSLGKGALRSTAGAIIGGIEGAKVGVKASDLKGAISAGKGVVGTKDGAPLGLRGTKITERISDQTSGAYESFTKAAFGTAMSRSKQAKDIADAREKTLTYDAKALARAGLKIDDLPIGVGDVAKLQPSSFEDFLGKAVYSAKKKAETPGLTDAQVNELWKGLTDDQRSSYNATGASLISSEGGLARLGTSYTQYQQNALAEQGKNSAQMMQLSNSIAQAQSQISALGSVAITSATLSSSIGGRIELSHATTSELASKIKTAEESRTRVANNTTMSYDDRKEELSKIDSALTAMRGAFALHDQLAKGSEEYQQLVDRQETIAGVVADIDVEYIVKDGKIDKKAQRKTHHTDAERELTLSKTIDKYKALITKPDDSKK